MRLLRIMVALAAILASVLLTAGPARAGGWAVTVLDPLPARLEAAHSYTVGYWVLQHGSHPYEGDLGRTALKLIGDNGRTVSFEGVALREPAHFAAAIAIPHAGRWKLYGLQGIFAEYQVGTLTVPGGLTVLRPPAPMTMHGDSHWGAIHPPDVAAMARDNALPVSTADGDTAVAPVRQPAAQQPAQPRQSDGGLPTAAVVAVILGLAAAGVAVLLGRRRMLRPASRARSRPR
ncbi:MAG TPA: hypothetical protein VFA45_11100 [Actinomycetes bacterium]|jgi:hypothetical protein|nr:hypothetical protein [Actinomycetes bacterium]